MSLPAVSASNRDAEFWVFLDRLVAEHALVLDRPRGSAHPRFPSLIYPLDYGYLEDTTTVDGGGIDVWRGSLPQASLDAVMLTVDLFKNDAELKLLLGCTAEEEQILLDFSNDTTLRATIFHRRTAPAQGPAAGEGTPQEKDPLCESPLLASLCGDGGSAIDLLDARRSVRRFTGEPVPREMIEQVLAAATRAPSAHNRQPWRFTVLTAAEPKERLAESMGAEFTRDLLADGLDPQQAAAQVERSRQRILQAPVVIMVSLDPSVEDAYPDPQRQAVERQMAVQSVAMAGENLLLAAQALGLGAVWICAPLFAPGPVCRALSLPASWAPQGLVLLGRPAKLPARSERLPLSAVASFPDP